MMDFTVTDKNSFLGEPSIEKMELCVKGEKPEWPLVFFLEIKTYEYPIRTT